MARWLGVFVHPADVQSEGLQHVFDRLAGAGVNAIAMTTSMAKVSRAGEGVRFPELHMDGYERVLARPLFGRKALYLTFHDTLDPDLSLYERTPYKPVVRPFPEELDRTLPGQIMEEAKRRGMEVHIQVTPFVTPKLQSQDQPRYVTGEVPKPPQVAMHACLNSPAARAYALALVEDKVAQVPQADGLFLDWAEYGAYRLEDHFTCFCPHCETKAARLGMDWERMVRDVRALWNWLHHLDGAKLLESRRVLSNPFAMVRLLLQYPGWAQLLQLKSAAVVSFYEEVRALLDRLGRRDVQLSARGWPPPWNVSSGMNYRELAKICHAVTPKLFTFDYSAMPRWYGQTLQEWNPALHEREILDAMVEWMQLPDDLSPRAFHQYNIPGPDVEHTARLECYIERIDEVVDQVQNRARCIPFAHAYLPDPQWKRMVAQIRDSRADGMWVQMYGYLSDAKFEILKNLYPS